MCSYHFIFLQQLPIVSFFFSFSSSPSSLHILSNSLTSISSLYKLCLSLIPVVYVLLSHLFPFFLCIALHNDVHMGYSRQAGLVTSAPLDPPCLLWSVYVYSLDGFDRELTMGHNTNVMGYPFLEGT